MEIALIKEICPSLLIFSSIAFSLLVALPRVRSWLKKEFDRRLRGKGKKLPFHDFFFFTFYLSIANSFDLVAFAYLVAIFFALLYPLHEVFAIVAYAVILAATSCLIVKIAIEARRSLRTTIASAKVDVTLSGIRKT